VSPEGTQFREVLARTGYDENVQFGLIHTYIVLIRRNRAKSVVKSCNLVVVGEKEPWQPNV
jgi:hypothetical protein